MFARNAAAFRWRGRLHDYHAMNASASRIARSAARQPQHRGTAWIGPTWPRPPSAAGTCRGPGRSPTRACRAARGSSSSPPVSVRPPLAGRHTASIAHRYRSAISRAAGDAGLDDHQSASPATSSPTRSTAPTASPVSADAPSRCSHRRRSTRFSQARSYIGRIPNSLDRAVRPVRA